MDATLDAFLSEINEIAPMKPKDCNEWKECFDSKSGFSYYWNLKTDEVTWEKPPGFIASSSSKSNNDMKSTPLFPSVLSEGIGNVKESVKIYKIASNCNTPIVTNLVTHSTNKKPLKKVQKDGKKNFRKCSNSNDEKIMLISSYGSDSESGNDSDEKNHSQLFSAKSNESDEEIDILCTVRKKAEEMKALSENNVKEFPRKEDESASKSKLSTNVPISGFSLVAGYDSNSDDENEHETNQNNNSIIECKTKSHSTLFPIMETPDIKDFIQKDEKENKQENKVSDNFDPKNFQRKRRLGINFTPSEKNIGHPVVSNCVIEEKRGLGFSSNDDKSDTPTCSNSRKNYPNFKSAGLVFVKQESPNNEDSDRNPTEIIDIMKLNKNYEIIREKLSFLCEGNKNLMPVQIILIQIETLYGALKADGLKPSYLNDWLEGTNEDLLKLEREAAPEGWLLQWDRSQKRYFYHNQSTGLDQWEYPQADSLRQEEAMDISTTPPPSEIEEHALSEVQPPLPPSPPGRSPSPPPPPTIGELKTPDAPNISKMTASDIHFEQPLPPGVDFSEQICSTKKGSQVDNDIKSVFDTFYLELAAIENISNSSSPTNVTEQCEKTDSTQEPLSEEAPKKKKKKVKMGQGLSLKKKDVSKLVEKWKNVQKNY